VGGAQVIIFSALEVTHELSHRVAAALVKSRVTPINVREQIISLLADARRRRESTER
jgi:hypothetical protein